MEQLNVCLLNDSFPPVIDGVANAVMNYARIIEAEHGHSTVVTPDYPGVMDDYDFPVVRYPSLDTTKLIGYRTGLVLSPEQLKTLEAADFDILHSHCPVVSTVLGRALRERTDRPLVFTYHTKFDIDIARAVRMKLMQEAAEKLLVENLSSADEVWVVSRGAGENLRSLGYEGDYVVMSNGVDLPKGCVSPGEIAAIGEGLDLPEGVPVFLFVGRLMWYKGLRLLLDGLKGLADAGRGFRMVFVGDGGDRAEIEEYSRELGLERQVIFAGAERDRERLRAWYCRADLLLFPSTFDTNGLVVREAAACGLPAVLVRGSCAAEGVTDMQNGLLIDENAGSLTALLLRVSCDPQLLRSLGCHAMDELYISWEESVSRACERYGTVIEHYRSAGKKHRLLRPEELFRGSGELSTALERARAQSAMRIERAKNELSDYLGQVTRYL